MDQFVLAYMNHGGRYIPMEVFRFLIISGMVGKLVLFTLKKLLLYIKVVLFILKDYFQGIIKYNSLIYFHSKKY